MKRITTLSTLALLLVGGTAAAEHCYLPLGPIAQLANQLRGEAQALEFEAQQVLRGCDDLDDLRDDLCDLHEDLADLQESLADAARRPERADRVAKRARDVAQEVAEVDRELRGVLRDYQRHQEFGREPFRHGLPFGGHMPTNMGPVYGEFRSATPGLRITLGGGRPRVALVNGPTLADPHGPQVQPYAEGYSQGYMEPADGGWNGGEVGCTHSLEARMANMRLLASHLCSLAGHR